MELLSGKLSHAEVCRKWEISSTFAYKLKDRSTDILCKGIGRPADRPSVEIEQLRRQVTDLEQLSGDQALLIRHFKKTRYEEVCRRLTLRSDNGSQPCSKKFVEYFGRAGVRGQYTGYNAPDDNAYIERVIRTIKEEEIWPNLYDSLSEARGAIEDYINYYNDKRIHSALGYQTPNEFAAAYNTLAAA